MKKHRFEIICLGLIILLGLTPLLWFIPGHLITGGDLDFPIFPRTRFVERLFVWNPIIRGGTQEAHNFTTLFFTGVEAFFSYFSKNIITVEKLTFIFWFTLMGLAILFTIDTLFGKKRPVLKISATIFWLFNFYQIYAWEIFRLDEIAALVALPPIIALYIKGVGKELTFRKILPWLIPLSFIASSIATNPTVALPLPFAFAIYLGLALIFKKTTLKFALKFSGLFAGVILLLNSYWILPFTQKVVSEGLADSSAKEEIYQADSLLKWTTKNNSFLNIMRSYGDVFLYDGFGGDPYLPFFEPYKHSRVLEALSFLVPVMAFLGLALSRSSAALYFGILALFALWFSKGPHEPFGNIYLILREKIPIFWTIRAPWQKFSIMTTLSYSILAGLFLEKVYHQLKSKRKLWLSALVVTLPLALNIYYLKGFIKGGMFPRPSERKVMPPYHCQIPDYVGQTFDWLNSQNTGFKILMLPEEKANIYTWGYGAPKAITFNYSKNPILFQQYGEGSYTPHPIDKRTDEIYRAIYESRGEDAQKLMQNLGIEYILQRNDFRYDFYGDYDSPEFIEEKLAGMPALELVKTFGEENRAEASGKGGWDIYQLKNPPKPLFYKTGSLFETSPQTSFVGLNKAGFNTATLTASDKSFGNAWAKVFGLEPVIEKERLGVAVYSTEYTTPGQYGQYTVNPAKDNIEIPIAMEKIMFSQTSLELETQRQYLVGKAVKAVGMNADSFAYQVAFSYRFSSNNDPKLYLYESSKAEEGVIIKERDNNEVDFLTESGQGEIVALNRVEVENDGLWHKKEVSLTPGPNTKGIGILLINEPLWGSHVGGSDIANQEVRDITGQAVPKKDRRLTLVSAEPPMEKDLTKIDFTKRNSTKYRLTLANTENGQPYFLVFGQNFDKGWKLTIDGQEVGEENHFVADGYANGWQVERGGAAILEYRPQRLFYYGLIVTGGALAGLMIWLIKRK